MSALTTSIQYCARVYEQCNKARKIKDLQIRKLEVKLSIHNLILYVENSLKFDPQKPKEKKKPTRTKCVQKGDRKRGQNTKISCISI